MTNIALGGIKGWNQEYKEGYELLQSALELSRRLDYDDGITQATNSLLVYRTAPQYTEERVKLAEETWARYSSTPSKITMLIPFLGDTYLAVAKRDLAEKFYKSFQNIAITTGLFDQQLQSLSIDALLALIDGNIEQSLEIAQQMDRMIEQMRGERGPRATARMQNSMRARLYLGRFDEIPEWNITLSPFLMAYTGRKEEALKMLENPNLRNPELGALFTMLNLEASVIVGYKELAEVLFVEAS